MNSIMEDIKAAGKLSLLVLSYIFIAYIAWRCGKYMGRAEYHDDLIRELDQKGGAPVLLYPPDQPKR